MKHAIDTLIRDTRYGLRRMARDWAFTAAAVLILGLAIGINTAIFSVVNAVLFREQAVANPDRLVNIYQNDPAGRPLIVTNYAAYMEIAEYSDLFATAAATIPIPSRYLHEGAIRSGAVEYSTATYLDVLGLRPSLGRWFERSEEQRGAPLVAIVGHRTWTRVFRADPSVIGRTIRMAGQPVTIVGVGPANHRGTIDIGVGTDFWLPITALPAVMAPTGQRDAPTIFAPLLVKARLRDGVTVARAAAAMDVLAQRWAAEQPEQFRQTGEFALGPGLTVIPSTQVRVHPQGDTTAKAIASVVLVAVSLVLAIACSNLATLLLVRGAARAKEISVRLAMGASRVQLVRHLLTESVLLALAGGLAGCLLAWWGMQALQRVDLPFTVDLTLDYRVLAFAIVVSVVTGILFGLAPALKATRVDLLTTLRDEGLPPIDHRRLTLKNGLIVVQVAVSVLLLGSASIFLQHAAAARAHRAGFAVDGVAILETDTAFAGYSENRATAVYDELQRRIEAIPGVESAALLPGPPMSIASMPVVIDSATATGSEAEAGRIVAGPGYFETLRIPLLFGRVFDVRDRAETPRVAVVTESMARKHFGDVNAVGRRFRPALDPNGWTEVIGVVRDTGTGSFTDDVLDPVAPPFYVLYTQSAMPPTTVIARTSGEARTLVAAMQRELRAVDVSLPVRSATTMAQALEASQDAPQAIAGLLAMLAGLGLVLAGIGLYAVVAFAVARRTREIGVRIALGARSQQVVWSIAGGMAGLIGVGTGVGLFLAILVMLSLRGTSGDTPLGNIAIFKPEIDPVALLGIAAVTAFVGVAAAFVPGRRAARLNPVVALRHD